MTYLNGKRKEKLVNYLLSTAAIATFALLAVGCNNSHDANNVGSIDNSASSPSQAASTTPSPSMAEAHPAKLTELLKLSSIGTTKEFLERTIGRSQSETEDVAVYRVEGCHVEVGLSGKTVVSISVGLLKGCRADIAELVGSSVPVPVDDSLTFSAFEKLAGDAQYHSPCLEMCGNAYDPYVDAEVPGYHANGFIDVVARAVQIDDSSISAANDWAQTLKAKVGDEYVMNTKFNCENTYNDFGRNAFAHVKVQEIIFGQGIDKSSCQ